MVFCLGSMLLFASHALTDETEMECCCQLTCNYVRILGGSPTTIEVNQCWDFDEIPACHEDEACLKVRTPFITYINEWSGSGCLVQEKCFFSFLFGSDNPQLGALRVLRDEVLRQSSEGNELIELYYSWSPLLVEAMQQDGKLKEEVKEMMRWFLPMLERGTN